MNTSNEDSKPRAVEVSANKNGDQQQYELASDLERIVSAWTTASSSLSSSSSGRPITVPPTTMQLFQIGQTLSSIRQLASTSEQARLQIAHIQEALHDMLQALSEYHRRTTFGEMLLAVMYMIDSIMPALNNPSTDQISNISTDFTLDQIAEALGAICELYAASSCASTSTNWSLADVAKLVSLHDVIIHEKNTDIKATVRHLQMCVLSVLSHWLWTKENVLWDDLLPTIHFLQDDETPTRQNIWNDLLEWKEDHTPGWRTAVLDKYPDHRDYLQPLLQTIRTTNDNELAAADELRDAIAKLDLRNSTGSGSSNNNINTNVIAAAPIVSTADELQRRIDQVCQVLPPDTGEGFVEICLSYYKGDVEQTVAALIDEESTALPAPLRHLDRSLPRRRHQDNNSKDDEQEARLIAKATLEAVQKQQEEEAYLIDLVMRQDAQDEYNDDYDDQYDETEGIGSAATYDSGLYDKYDAIKAYNRAMKDIVQDQSFWQENRNMNRMQKPQKSKATSEDDDEAEEEDGGGKAYRGPDKMRGGRIPGRGRGGNNNRAPRGQNGGQNDLGRGGGRGPAAPTNVDPVGGSAASTSGSSKKINTRAKERRLAKRKEQQKQADVKRNS